jgi:hypothetical protein
MDATAAGMYQSRIEILTRREFTAAMIRADGIDHLRRDGCEMGVFNPFVPHTVLHRRF